MLLAGGQDRQGTPVDSAQLYRPIANRLEAVTPVSAAHQHPAKLWLDPSGRPSWSVAIPAAAASSGCRAVRTLVPGVADRPQIPAAPAAIAHHQPFTAQLQLAAGTTSSTWGCSAR